MASLLMFVVMFLCGYHPVVIGLIVKHLTYICRNATDVLCIHVLIEIFLALVYHTSGKQPINLDLHHYIHHVITDFVHIDGTLHEITYMRDSPCVVKCVGSHLDLTMQLRCRSPIIQMLD